MGILPMASHGRDARATTQFHNGELRQPALALVQNVEILKRLEAGEHHIAARRNNFLPIFFCGVRDGRGHQAEIAAKIVRPDIELVAQVVGIVFHILLARGDQLPRAARIRSIQITHLGSSVAGRGQEDPSVAARLVRADVEALVFLFVNESSFLLSAPRVWP